MQQSAAITLTVVSLYTSRTLGQPSLPVTSIHMLPDYGIEGDVHTGFTRIRSTGETVRNIRHFTAVNAQELGEVAERLQVPYLDPSWLSANICLTGPENFTQTLVEDTILLNAAGHPVLKIKGPTEPCLEMGERIAAKYPLLSLKPQLFPKLALNRRGVFGIALEETSINLYDTFSALLPTNIPAQ